MYFHHRSLGFDVWSIATALQERESKIVQDNYKESSDRVSFTSCSERKKVSVKFCCTIERNNTNIYKDLHRTREDLIDAIYERKMGKTE